MTKKINLCILLILAIINVSGQQLNLMGSVFELENGKATTFVPFATVYYYNYEDTTKVEFCALTSLTGEYHFYNLRNGRYLVKITAPGYQPKRQEVQFDNVKHLAEKNNGEVYAHIAMKRVDNTQISPLIFQVKDLMQSNDDTLEKIIEQLKAKVKDNKSNKRKSYRIWLGGREVTAKLYNDMKEVTVMALAKMIGDKSLKKTYIEYYDLSGKDKTLADGVFNIVFNDKSRRPADSKFLSQETTDFFIKK